LGWLALITLLLFQAFAYYARLPLSLGPRVILQPWLLQNGMMLYENIADQHTPLMSLLLWAITPAFPNGFNLARTVLVFLISLTTLLIFLVGNGKDGWKVGLGAAAFFVLWSPIFDFGKLWHETFLAPLYLLFFFFYNSSAPYHSKKFLFLLGLLGGTAILVKQHAVIVLSAFIIWNAFTYWHTKASLSKVLRDSGFLVLGAVVPIIAFVAYHYLKAGTLENFAYWTIGFNFFGSFRSLAAQSPTLEEIQIIAPAFLLIPAAILLLIELKKEGDKKWLNLGWGLIWLVTSSLMAYPRFGFFQLQAALPALAWLSAVTLACALRRSQSVLRSASYCARGIALGLCAFWIVMAGSTYRFVVQPDQPRKISEYSDLVPLAAEIRQQIGPSDCIYIFPDDEATANLYYLLKCLPPKFWVFSYPWFMLDQVKTRILQTIRPDPPDWIIYFPGRWDIENSAPEIMTFVQRNYRQFAPLHWAQGDGWLLKRAQ